MDERTIKLDLETAKRWFNKGGELKEIALQAYAEKELSDLPKTWEQCCNQLGEGEYIRTDSCITYLNTACKATAKNRNMLPIGLGKPMLALHQLLVCRDVYRRGWKPNSKGEKHCIYYIDGEPSVQSNFSVHRVLSFQTAEIRDEFFNNFRDLIEEARELI